MSELNSAILKNLFGKLGVYLIQLLSLIILARMFEPKVFGILASISVFLVFFQLIAEVGIGPALINDGKISKSEQNGIFTLTLLSGVMIGCVFYFFVRYLSLFYNDDIYLDLAWLFSLIVPISCLSIVPTTNLIKDYRFAGLAIIDGVSLLISIACTMILSTKLEPIYALALKSPIYFLAKLILAYIASYSTTSGMPNIGFDFGAIKRIKSFVKYQLAFSFINYFSRNSDDIVVGKALGSTSLGIYSQAYNIMKYPLQLITFGMGTAIQAVLTNNRDNVSYLIYEHNKLAKKLMFVSLPISLYFIFNSHLIVEVLLGGEWIEVAPILTILAVTIPIQIVTSTTGAFFQVLNRADLLFKGGLIGATIFVTLIIFSAYFGSLKATAICVALAFFINSFCTYYILFNRGFKISVLVFGKIVLNCFTIMVPYVIFYTFVNEYVVSLISVSNSVFYQVMLSLVTLILSSLPYVIIIRMKYLVKTDKGYHNG
ncbi:oligosaccharide flippase family protein [Vibrio artabrorum]|uniref:oligosaccharide flippase family protein n=1 Tax=Vibrio artabrorum TaxID=446374 RepID=UPI00354BD065